MSELQISLLAIGFLIVVAVYGFNRFQENKYRRRMEQAFPVGHKDVLLRDSSPDAHAAAKSREYGRVEPTVSATADEPPAHEVRIDPEIECLDIDAVSAKNATAIEPEVENAPPASHLEELALDESIDYVVQLYPAEPVAVAILAAAVQRHGGAGKRSRWLGMNPLTGCWEEIGPAGGAKYRNLAVALQLADRSGPVSEQDMAAFCGRVQAVADELAAIAEFSGQQHALARAAALDQFGADVDVLIGVNVATQDGEAFPATKVRALAEAAGMKLLPDGAFHFINDEGADLFSLGNLDPTPFSAENIRQLSTHGVTFLFDVPRVADGVRVFNQMLLVAKQMASTLGGQVVDDNRRPLSEAGTARIKQQLADIYARMEAQQIGSGSDCAQRLFS